jgi:hypothetical protein
MTTNELMRHLLTDISDTDRRHLVEVVDRNHAEQLARKRRSQAPDEAGEAAVDDDADAEDAESWDDHLV